MMLINLFYKFSSQLECSSEIPHCKFIKLNGDVMMFTFRGGNLLITLGL